MATTTTVLRSLINEDGSITLMARVEDRPTAPNTAGTAFTQTSFSEVKLWAFDRDSATPNTGLTNYNGITLTITSVILNTLAGWDVDSTGHNFRYTTGTDLATVGGHVYGVEVRFTHTDGRVGWALYELTAQSVRAS